MSDDDAAMWRRCLIEPFTHQPAAPDPTVKATLCDPAMGGPAVLAWALEGCLAWQAEGLGLPPAVREATCAVRAEMDPLLPFFEACCLFEDGIWTSNAALRSAYACWADENGIRLRVGGKAWGERLRARGCTDGRRSHVRGWVGIRLADGSEPTQDAMQVEWGTEGTENR